MTEPVAVHAAVVDALLEIDAHYAERRQMPPPIISRVDVLGADGCRVAGDIIHDAFLPYLCTLYAAIGAAVASQRRFCLGGGLASPKPRRSDVGAVADRFKLQPNCRAR